ncbi:MAG: hypothetical protein EBX40_05490 [Gammaproteobacteria bacterium]|nr:hypothetical protein [Gammaproteobacteria bacterium]
MSDYTEYFEYYKKAWEKSLSERTSELQAENARLREALVMIIEGTDNKYPHPCSLDHEEINGISREALKGEA